jgi:hypothetical protein
MVRRWIGFGSGPSRCGFHCGGFFGVRRAGAVRGGAVASGLGEGGFDQGQWLSWNRPSI